MRDEQAQFIAKAVCVLSLCILAVVIILAARPDLRGQDALQAYRVGQSIDLEKEVYEGSRRTLLIFQRDDCPACSAFRPYAAKLIAAARAQKVRIRIVVPGQSTSDIGTQLDLDHDEIVLSVGGLRLLTVPTVAVVNDRGNILYVKEGRPMSVAEEQKEAAKITSVL